MPLPQDRRRTQIKNYARTKGTRHQSLQLPGTPTMWKSNKDRLLCVGCLRVIIRQGRKCHRPKQQSTKKSVPTGEPLLTVLAKVEKRAIRAPVFPHHRQRRATRREEERKTKKNGLLHFVQKRRLSLAFRFTCDSRRKIFQTKCWVS